jgi:4-oxalocrotonate tautomerase
MPHVIVKLWPGKSEKQKTRLAEAITKDVMDVFGYAEESISVAMEEVEPQDWTELVYKPDILNKAEQLHKKPGYDVSEPQTHGLLRVDRHPVNRISFPMAG